MKPLAVLAREACSEEFARWENSPAFAAANRHPFFSIVGRRYYAATYDQDIDTSFAVVQGNEPLMLVFCNIHESILGLYGQPMALVPCEGIDQSDCVSAVGAVVAELDRLADKHAAREVVIRENIVGSLLSALGHVCVARGATAQVMQHGFCDLTLDETVIHRGVRKSFRSLINAGRRDMRMVYVNAGNPDKFLFDAYGDFHARVAGRVTRSERSWQAMFEWIVGGGGELALAYHNDNELVAGTMTMDGSEVCYYASGVYDRSQFDKPLAHFPVYDAILRSRGRNMRRYDLGVLTPKGVGTDKEYSIGHFKRGFATFVDLHLVWTWKTRSA